MGDKKYTSEGFLIVSESDKCPLWEKTTQPGFMWCTKDCFYCKYSDFRTPEFISKMENVQNSEKMHSVCRNEKNKRQENPL